MKFYISGKREDRERYEMAAEQLAEEGHEVINFLEVSGQLPGMTEREQKTMQRTLIKMCDAIFALNGWKESDLATREILFGLTKQKNIIFEQKL